MRIWDIPVEKLCRQHLLGEHRELHAIWSILTGNKQGYKHHPETSRWQGKLAALYKRHEEQVEEMSHRGYRHQSPLDINLATGKPVQNESVNSHEKQSKILRGKNCGCQVKSQS